MTTQNTQQQTGGEFAALANSAPFEREPTVGIQVMRRRWGPFRPVLWLMCPWKLETWTRGTSQHFQVGEFRDWRSANLAKGRLEDVLRKQWGKAQKIDLMDAASHAPDSLETPSGVPCGALLGLRCSCGAQDSPDKTETHCWWCGKDISITCRLQEVSDRDADCPSVQPIPAETFHILQEFSPQSLADDSQFSLASEMRKVCGDRSRSALMIRSTLLSLRLSKLIGREASRPVSEERPRRPSVYCRIRSWFVAWLSNPNVEVSQPASNHNQHSNE